MIFLEGLTRSNLLIKTIVPYNPSFINAFRIQLLHHTLWFIAWREEPAYAYLKHWLSFGLTATHTQAKALISSKRTILKGPIGLALHRARKILPEMSSLLAGQEAADLTFCKMQGSAVCRLDNIHLLPFHPFMSHLSFAWFYIKIHIQLLSDHSVQFHTCTYAWICSIWICALILWHWDSVNAFCT